MEAAAGSPWWRRGVVRLLRAHPGGAFDPLRPLVGGAVVHRTAEPEARARLAAMGRAYVDFAIREPHAFALVYDAQLCPPHDASPERAPLIAANERLLAEVLADAQRSGFHPGTDTRALSDGFWGAIHGLAVLAMAGHLSPDAARAGLRALVG